MCVCVINPFFPFWRRIYQITHVLKYLLCSDFAKRSTCSLWPITTGKYYVAILVVIFAFSSGSSHQAGRGGARNMKSIWPPLAAIFLLPANEVWGKVMFLHLSVNPRQLQRAVHQVRIQDLVRGPSFWGRKQREQFAARVQCLWALEAFALMLKYAFSDILETLFL